MKSGDSDLTCGGGSQRMVHVTLSSLLSPRVWVLGSFQHRVEMYLFQLSHP